MVLLLYFNFHLQGKLFQLLCLHVLKVLIRTKRCFPDFDYKAYIFYFNVILFSHINALKIKPGIEISIPLNLGSNVLDHLNQVTIVINVVVNNQIVKTIEPIKLSRLIRF